MANLRRFFEAYPRDTKATVPYGFRVNDVIYGGSIPGTRPASGEPAPGGPKEQMAEALKHLITLMEKGGASLDNVGRCVGYVTTPEHREPVYEAWDELFPDPADCPAFKVLIRKLPEGHLAHLDALGLIGGRRTRVDIPNVPARDPSVQIGNWFFTSRCHGLNQVDGGLVDGGLEAETNQTLTNIATLMGFAGGSTKNITQVTMFGRDDSYFAESKRIFEQWFPDEPTRPQLNQLVSFVTARFAISIEASAVIPQTTGNRGELWHEQWICPGVDPVANAIRIDDVVIAPALTPVDASTGAIPAGVDAQIRGVMANLDQLLANSELTRGDVARVSFFLRDLDQRKQLNAPWEAAFPDPQGRPPHKYVKASLPDGVDVMAQVIAFAGTTRRVLAIDAVVHHDPMSLGAVTGNLLTTSRILSGQPGDDAAEQTALAFANVDALLKQASASFANVQQLTVLIDDAKYGEGVERELGRYLNKQGGAPVLNVLTTELGGGGFPRLEVIALV